MGEERPRRRRPAGRRPLFETPVLIGVALAFIAFCLVSASVYLVNDVRDVEEDRLHPRKRFRPIAAGELKPATALMLAGITGVAGLGLGYAVTLSLGITLAVYVAIQLLYSVFLKHLPVVDLAVVASGFLLRAIAGGVATGIPLCQWFLLVAAFGSFFMVAGKRYSEMKAIGGDAGTRRSLTRYSESYLRFTWMLAAVMVLISYSLWAFENPAGEAASPTCGVPWTAISIAPFTLGLLQYALEVDAGSAGEPEDVVLHDRVLQGIGVIWLGDLGGGVLVSDARRARHRALAAGGAAEIPQPLVELHGWGRTSGTMTHLAAIDSVADAVSALRTSAPQRGVVPRGLGRSYGDAAQNAGGTTIDLTR